MKFLFHCQKCKREADSWSVSLDEKSGLHNWSVVCHGRRLEGATDIYLLPHWDLRQGITTVHVFRAEVFR